MRNRKKIIAAFLAVCICIIWGTKHVQASSPLITIKVPKDAVVSFKGVMLDQTAIIEEDIIKGRIHSLAANKTGITRGYYVYGVRDITSPSDIEVIDSSGRTLSPTGITSNSMEFLQLASPDFEAEVKQRIERAAIAYHNRVGGYGGGDFGSYFLANSDAYQKMVRSDSGRKWGQYVSARNVVSAKASEICVYSDSVFTARVDVSATGSYAENYTIYYLLQKNGEQYFVTDFTY